MSCGGGGCGDDDTETLEVMINEEERCLHALMMSPENHSDDWEEEKDCDRAIIIACLVQCGPREPSHF